MCRIPKVLVVAPEAMHADLRRALSSFEYDIAACVARLSDAEEVSADVAVLWEPDDADVAQARARSLKPVAIGGDAEADLRLEASDIAAFKTRVWELFRPV